MERTVGIQDFGKIRENDYFYNKTGFLKEWWESGDISGYQPFFCQCEGGLCGRILERTGDIYQKHVQCRI